ncbi:hypothetical protein [Hymenobacter mucosus]|uniref:Uncharacterized protein n=1 Tax=Hymenobacter mucosus TaxID=1411120 RepID=A0A239A6Z8_9BACT|nr:hypothetical protein [Hymenobacter mucosus]SNR91405.1 hypothetical protein SAMN06269173_11130 [Hymenobacter mucosus]
MPAKKHPKREEFEAQRGEWLNDLPPNYAGIVTHYRPDLNKRRIWDVRHGNIVDMDILGELRRVAREAKAARAVAA